MALANDLRKSGGNIWIDKLDIRPGKPWDLEIEKALETATCVLFIATAQSTGSTNVLNEVYYALEENKEVIPVIFGDCRIPFRLKRLQHIDFTVDYDSAFDRLLTALNLQKQIKPVQPQSSDAKDGIDTKNPSVQESKDEKAKEQLFWNTIYSGSDITAYEEYLRLYPNGNFTAEAIQQINILKQEAKQAETQKAPKNIPKLSSIKETAPAQMIGKSQGTIKVVGIGIAVLLLLVYLLISPKKPDRKIEPGVARADTILNGNEDSQLIKRNPVKPNSEPRNKGTIEQPRQVDSTIISSRPTEPRNPPRAGKKPMADTSYYHLELKNSGQFLDATYCSNTVGLNNASDFADGACQLWRLVPVGDGWNKLELKSGGKYLSLDNCTAHVVLRAGSSYDANDGCQLWRFIPAGEGWGRLQLKTGKQYLDADHCTTTVALNPGSDFANGACQLWRFVHQ